MKVKGTRWGWVRIRKRGGDKRRKKGVNVDPKNITTLKVAVCD